MLSKAPVNILLVDDSPENLLTIKSILNNPEYRIVEASNGREALRHLMEQDFAVIILDVVMPILDGFETAKLIRAREHTRHLPIIFKTAFSSDEPSINEGYIIGAVDYLTSPIIPEILQAKVSIFVELFRKTQEIKEQTQIIQSTEQSRFAKQLEAERLAIREQYLIRERELEIKNRKELEKHIQLLAESNSRLEDFAHLTCHDLQEPLRTISMYVNLLSDRLKPVISTEDADLLEQVNSSAKNMSRLIKDILEYARVDKAESEEKKDFEFEAVLKVAIENLKASILDTKAKIICDTLPRLKGYPNHVVLLIQNLISNSIKFRGQDAPVIQIDVVKEGNFWHFIMKDNGIGFDPRYSKKIFDIFNRLNSKDRYAGSGMGLAIVKKIVTLHGGDIWAESKPKEGATFHFLLPSAEPAIQRLGSLHGMKILVTDDSHDSRELIRRALSDSGCQLELSDSGLDAIERVKTTNYDLVLMDIEMPGLDGYETTEQIRRLNENLSIVAFTSHPLEEVRKRAGTRLFNDCWEKFTEPKTLISNIANWKPGNREIQSHAM